MQLTIKKIHNNPIFHTFSIIDLTPPYLLQNTSFLFFPYPGSSSCGLRFPVHAISSSIRVGIGRSKPAADDLAIRSTSDPTGENNIMALHADLGGDYRANEEDHSSQNNFLLDPDVLTDEPTQALTLAVLVSFTPSEIKYD
ncbi:unnamed protein product [Protopolystoma xenopodis]|uniref:Uncharacterized protein n=1 Tax=Protopolystoma xenopodis TaxID=117903 RepID=A0A3S5B0H3_9PLAT|nr:unnamed protein product [Protopolystoma xenopodis]